MKQIRIVYSDTAENERIAEEITTCFPTEDYVVTKNTIRSIPEMESFLSDTNPENCQIVINLNMTGYAVETTGGFASFNRLPMNLVNYITDSMEIYDEALKKNQSYMSWFVFRNPNDKEKAEKLYPHLWHTKCAPDTNALIELICSMDLRYE